jgi:hypothetical protein
MKSDVFPPLPAITLYHGISIEAGGRGRGEEEEGKKERGMRRK